MDIEAFIRPDLLGLPGYHMGGIEQVSARLGIPVSEIIKLDANENPYGPTPQARAALRGDLPVGIYPDADHTQLRAALGDYLGQPAAGIVCGNGSDEVIDLLVRLTVGPGEVVVQASPTFAMYSLYTKVAGGRMVDVPRGTDWRVDGAAVGAAVRRERAKLVFLPSPNNPDGSLLPRDVILELLQLPVLVVVDEAYAEFSGDTAVDLLAAHPNLVVLRTFSKWAGLAGLRIGYGVMHPALAERMRAIKAPYNVNAVAQAAALASLADRPVLAAHVALIVAERERLHGLLADLPNVTVLPSHANFLLVQVGPQARAIKQALEGVGILVRDYGAPPLNTYLRISIGTPAQSDQLVAAWQAALPALENL